ncbi:hypothetical protein FRC01_008570 [Tulasnella sp. 417]|nr:hypothetical protein FRC01_008570 [Tulasnella sp. 417]
MAYHPQTDGATEHANKTMVQMIRQCISPDQKNWAIKLPGIEFAMNSARSETTGFSPFFLNYGRTPSPMIWDHESEYPGVCEFALRMKEAIMTAHDAVIAARVQQTHYANKRHHHAEFAEGDLVYLSTENLNLPKGRSRKLVPRYIGPYKINKVKSPGASFELELPIELQRRGIHPVFHASLLRPHIPNDNRKFLGRDLKQVSAFECAPKEYMVNKIVSHFGKGKDAVFRVTWTSGDTTWMTYHEVIRADVLRPYCEAMGVVSVDSLLKGREQPPNDVRIECAMMGLKGIKRHLSSTWSSSKPTPNPIKTPSISITISDISMNIHFTDSEILDFYNYNACRARRLVAQDEGKTFNEILQKLSGYDGWAESEDSISIANWISEKRDRSDLNVKDLGRRLLKRAVFQGMSTGPYHGAGRPRSGLRHSFAARPLGLHSINNIPLVAGPGSTFQLAQVGGGPTAYQIPDSAASNSFATATTSVLPNAIITKNACLRHELEELRACEGVISRLGHSSGVEAAVPNEVGINIIGLTVADPPIVHPIPKKAVNINGDTAMEDN